MSDSIAGVVIPDTPLVRAITAHIHDIGLTERYRASTKRFDFKRQILAAFNEGTKHRPQTTFGTCNADVLKRFDPTFTPDNFVDNILNSSWPA